MARKPVKSRKNGGRNVVEMDENVVEMDDEGGENGSEIEQSSPFEQDEYDVLYEVKQKLESSGLSTKDEIKFMLKKKNEKGQFAHSKSYWGEMPDLDEIGERYGGGDFLLMVYANGEYKFSKTFQISKEAYPTPKPVDERQVIPSNNNEIAERLIEENKELRGKSEKNSTDMLTLMMNQMNQNTQLLITAMQNKNTAPVPTTNSLDDTIKLLTLFKTLDKDNKGIDYNMVMDLVGNTFNNGMNLALQMIEKKDEEGLGDVLTNLVKTFAKNINPEALLKGSSLPTKQLEEKTTGNATDNKNIQAKQVLALVQEYFQMVKLAYDEGQAFDFLVHLACKTQKYKVIKMYADKFDNNTLLQFVSGAGFGEFFKDEDFKLFVFDILDNVRDYDKLKTEESDDNETEESDEDETEEGDEIPDDESEDISEEDIPDDSAGTGNEQSGNKDNGEHRPANNVNTEGSSQPDSSGSK